MIVYVENSKDSTKKKKSSTKNFNKVAGYKTNIWKSIVFLLATYEHMDTNVKYNNIYYCSKNMKFLGINLIKQRICM